MVCVLLVDDEIVSLEALGALFKLDGFDVVYATDGMNGLMEAQKSSPDLVVTDWEMPRLDGIGLCRALRQLAGFARIPLVLTSGKEPPQCAGSWDLFLRKPIDFILLEPVIRRARFA